MCGSGSGSGSRSRTCQANQYECKNKSGLGRDGNIHLSTKEEVDFFHFLSQLGPSASAVRTQLHFQIFMFELRLEWIYLKFLRNPKERQKTSN